MPNYFITGTDTDCGKTYITCQLLSRINQQYSAQALKPVASGCDEVALQLQHDDVSRLQRHNKNPQLLINAWRYSKAIAPHLAAQTQGEVFTAADIAKFCNSETFRAFDYLLVEGAGGLLVPLNTHETWLDFLKLTGMTVILVVGMRLGCLNHALLTDAVLAAHGIPCLGWIANCCDQSMLATDENIATLSAMMHMPLIATVPFGGEIDNLLD